MVSTDYWKPKANAPIFFFTGAEGGDITALYDYAYSYTNTVAQTMDAMIVYMEHRYFGYSQPFGPTESYNPTYVTHDSWHAMPKHKAQQSTTKHNKAQQSTK